MLWRDRVCNVCFPTDNILLRSGDIPDQVEKLSRLTLKSHQNVDVWGC